MKELMMLKGAKTLIDVCTKVKPNENVLIVTDLAQTHIARALATIALDRGAETITMVMKPRARSGQEPPGPVAEAMKAADVVFVPVSFSITHTHAVKNAAAAGARLIVMTDFTPEMMTRGGIEADFEALKPTCLAVADRLGKGRKIRVDHPRGHGPDPGCDGATRQCALRRGRAGSVFNDTDGRGQYLPPRGECAGRDRL